MKNIKEKIEIIGAILFAVGFWIVLIWLLNKGCSTEPTQQTINKDSLNTIIAEKTQINDYLKNENKAIKLITDSLKALKPKVIVRYKTVYDSLLVVDTMCVQALNTLHDEHSKIDSVNNHIITNQETHIINDSHIINNLNGVIQIQEYIIRSDSNMINSLKMTVKKEKRKGKLKTILGTAIGTLAGFGLGGLR